MAKTPTNLTLHSRILELAAQLQAELGYSSLSTLVESLIREEYERRFGKIGLYQVPEREPSSLNETSSSPPSNSSRVSAGVDRTDKFLQGLTADAPALAAPKPPAKPTTKRPNKPDVQLPKEKGKKQRAAARAALKHPSTT